MREFVKSQSRTGGIIPKDLGEKSVSKLHSDGPYRSFQDFFQRVKPDPAQARALIRAGCGDSIAGELTRPTLNVVAVRGKRYHERPLTDPRRLYCCPKEGTRNRVVRLSCQPPSPDFLPKTDRTAKGRFPLPTCITTSAKASPWLVCFSQRNQPKPSTVRPWNSSRWKTSRPSTMPLCFQRSIATVVIYPCQTDH